MKRNISEVEQRLLLLLRKDSRTSIIDAARELGISRITAKKALDSLISEGKIRSFTVTLNEDLKDLALVHVKSIDGLPNDVVIEHFSMIDGTFLLVMYFENLVRIKSLDIIDVKFAGERVLNTGTGRLENIHCDYCNQLIPESPIVFEIAKKTYYACCPNCERDLRKRREAMPGA